MLSWPFLQSNFEPCDVQPLAYESHRNLRQNLSWLFVHKWLVLSLWICPPLDESIPVPLALPLDEWTASDEGGLGTEQPAKNYFISTLRDITNTILSPLSTELLAKLKVVRYQVLIALLPRIQVFWDMALFCWVSGPQHFRGTSAFIFKDKGSLFLDCLPLWDIGTVFLHSIRNHSPYDTASQSMWPNPPAKLLKKKSPRLNYSKSSLHVMKPAASLLCLHELITCPYSQPNKPACGLQPIFLFEIHINITLPTLCNIS